MFATDLTVVKHSYTTDFSSAVEVCALTFLYFKSSLFDDVCKRSYISSPV